MPDLTIRIKKKTDGTAALICTRADGTLTRQRQEKQLGAVESVLGFDGAFWGLIAEGWEVSDFAPDVAVDEEQLPAIRARCDDLFARWRAVRPGEALELPFTRRGASSAA